MKTLSSLLLAALIVSSPLIAQDSAPQAQGLTLSQAIDSVLARYPTLDAAQAAVDSARGRTIQSNADRLPQVSAHGVYDYMSLRPYVEFALPTGTSSFHESIQNSYNVALNVKQLLTDFGRTDALVALARSGEMSAKDALEQVRSQLGYQTIQAFYGIVLLRSSVSVANEEITALDEALRISEKKFSGGSATRFDVLTTKVRLVSAQNNLTSTQAALEKQEAVMRQLLGLAPGAPVGLSGSFENAGPLPDLSSTIADGLRQRPEMKMARDSADSASLKLDAASRQNRPTLDAQAAGGMEDGQLPALYDNKGYVTAGVSLSVPIFTGKRITGQKVEARADLRGAQARISELNGIIATDVADALSDLKAAQSRLVNTDTLVDQAQEALSLAKTRYTNGVITNFELLDAQSAARSAELERLQAQYDCTLARQAVARAAGQPPQAQAR